MIATKIPSLPQDSRGHVLFRFETLGITASTAIGYRSVCNSVDFLLTEAVCLVGDFTFITNFPSFIYIYLQQSV